MSTKLDMKKVDLHPTAPEPPFLFTRRFYRSRYAIDLVLGSRLPSRKLNNKSKVVSYCTALDHFGPKHGRCTTFWPCVQAESRDFHLSGLKFQGRGSSPNSTARQIESLCTQQRSSYSIRYHVSARDYEKKTEILCCRWARRRCTSLSSRGVELSWTCIR